MMKRAVFLVLVAAVASAAWLMAQPAEVSLVDGFRTVEVASVSDAMEQLYGQRAYMSHDMPRFPPPSSPGLRSRFN
jgi:4-hydroxy-4-methyl-2-oxoglutarate aldolase